MWRHCLSLGLLGMLPAQPGHSVGVLRDECRRGLRGRVKSPVRCAKAGRRRGLAGSKAPPRGPIPGSGSPVSHEPYHRIPAGARDSSLGCIGMPVAVQPVTLSVVEPRSVRPRAEPYAGVGVIAFLSAPEDESVPRRVGSAGIVTSARSSLLQRWGGEEVSEGTVWVTGSGWRGFWLPGSVVAWAVVGGRAGCVRSR